MRQRRMIVALCGLAGLLVCVLYVPCHGGRDRLYGFLLWPPYGGWTIDLAGVLLEAAAVVIITLAVGIILELKWPQGKA